MLGVPTWRVLPTTYDSLCDRVAVYGVGSKEPRVILSGTGLDTQERVVQLERKLNESNMMTRQVELASLSPKEIVSVS